jgi:hypothetical protein
MLTTHRRLTTARRVVPILSATSLTLLIASILSLHVFAPAVHAAQISLEWDANREPDLSGYRIYYGTSSGHYSASVDVGNSTHCVISNLVQGVTYYFAATAYDSEGNESDFSEEIVYTVPAAVPGPASPSSVGGGDGGGGGCFIATAAYGSYLAPEVTALRRFRDQVLLVHAPGRAFVRVYYRLSPPIADFIGEHEFLRSLTRWTLTPLVYGVKYPEASGGVLFAALAIAFVARVRKDQYMEEPAGNNDPLFAKPHTGSDLQPKGD